MTLIPRLFAKVFGFFAVGFALLQRKMGRSLFERAYNAKLEQASRGTLPSTLSKAEENIFFYGHDEAEPISEKNLRSCEIFAPAYEVHAEVPVIVFLHGGAWVASDRNDPGGVHQRFCQGLAAKGFPVVNANYRLCNLPRKPGRKTIQLSDQLADVALLCEHLLKHDILNSRKRGLLLAGHSSGGHIALQAALSGLLKELVSALRGVYVLGGVYDLESFCLKADFFVKRLALPKTGFFQLSQKELQNFSPRFVRNAKETKNDGLRFAIRLVHGARDHELLIQAQESVLNLQALKMRATLRIFQEHDHFSILGTSEKSEESILADLAEFAIDSSHFFVRGKVS